MAENSSQYITCRCQQCNGGIEFDASGFQPGETQTTECPHCKMETILFVPASETTKPPPLQKNASQKLETARKRVRLLWIMTAILFMISGKLEEDKSLWIAHSVTAILSVASLIAALIATGKYNSLKPKPRAKSANPNYICTNCGTLQVWALSYRPAGKEVCSECRMRSVVPLNTPRGQELLATYHGAVTAKERVEIGDEAIRRLLLTLEPSAISGGIAAELEKLARLVQTGAITHDEWQRAKNLYLGQPQNKREHALAKIRELYDLQQSGAVSESEFNSVKWDILSRGVV